MVWRSPPLRRFGRSRRNGADDGVVSLFNGKDLTGWKVFVNPKTTGYDADSRPERIFKVNDGVIHVSGERFACLTTEKEFENYRLTVEFKWGDKHWRRARPTSEIPAF